MAKKAAPKKKIRKMRAAGGGPEFPAEFLGGWFALTLTAELRRIAKAREQNLVDVERQAFVEFVDRHKEESGT